ncbi:MAG: hypothetical protein I8H81_04875 [Pseudomonadales bacterium]|nr:hypothetical protein [Pseudomonadales bacterium]MBH2031453.1 hypothetical protein [Pseudomonadales bacterium]MBH2074803.1 hypothetical protein [Pseudomonadales bacterium]
MQLGTRGIGSVRFGLSGNASFGGMLAGDVRGEEHQQVLDDVEANLVSAQVNLDLEERAAVTLD